MEYLLSYEQVKTHTIPMHLLMAGLILLMGECTVIKNFGFSDLDTMTVSESAADCSQLQSSNTEDSSSTVGTLFMCQIPDEASESDSPDSKL